MTDLKSPSPPWGPHCCQPGPQTIRNSKVPGRIRRLWPGLPLQLWERGAGTGRMQDTGACRRKPCTCWWLLCCHSRQRKKKLLTGAAFYPARRVTGSQRTQTQTSFSPSISPISQVGRHEEDTLQRRHSWRGITDARVWSALPGASGDPRPGIGWSFKSQ